MTELSRKAVLFTAAMVGLGFFADVAQAAVFTVNIFDLQNNRRSGEVITVTVTAIDENNRIVVNPNVNFDGDAIGGVLVITTQKNVEAGRTVVTVNDGRVRAVTFSFSGNNVFGTTDQRLRNVNDLEFEVAVPRRAQGIDCPPPCCLKVQPSKCRWLPRLFRR